MDIPHITSMLTEWNFSLQASTTVLASGTNAHVQLGPRKSRAPHDQQKRLEVTDYTLLPKLLRRHPEVRRVTAGSLRWTPFDLLRTFLSTPSDAYAYAFLVYPSRLAAGVARENAAADDATVELALPRNDLLSLAASPEKLRLHAVSDIRLVNVCILPLSLDGTVTPQPESPSSEIILHLNEPNTFSAAGQFLRGVGERLEDLTLRLNHPQGVIGGQVGALCQALGLQACASLVSLTLCLTFFPGHAAPAHTQWHLALALLRSVGPFALRRIRLVVVVAAAANGLCDSIASQIKQTRWHNLGEELTRFPNIEEVAVAVLGEGSEDSEVWQDVEFALRGVVPKGVRIVHDQGCIL